MRGIAHCVCALLAIGVGSGSVAGQDACESQRVTAPSSIEVFGFPFAVAQYQDQWFLSDPDANTLCSGSPFSCSTGAVFAYEEVEGRLVRSQTIVPDDLRLYDKFGISVDVDNGRLAIGSLFTKRPASEERPGAVFIFEHDGSQWQEITRVEPPPEVTSEFAGTVELHERTLVVNEFGGDRSWVYHERTSGWELVQTVLPPDPLPPPPAQAFFGYEWAVNGDWFVAGAPADGSILPLGGSVHIYRRQPDGTLEYVQKIAATETMYLGISMDFAGDTLVIGAPYASRDELYQGVVQLYEFDGERWVLDEELMQNEVRENRQFGDQVVADDDRIFARSFNEYTPISRGMVHLFERQPDGSWLQTERMEPSPFEYAGSYGNAMALAGDRLLVGASGDEPAPGESGGAAYFFDLACTDCPPDLDADGALTIFDFLAFANLFEDGDATADFDGDGELTVFDFLEFQDAFDAGCE